MRVPLQLLLFLLLHLAVSKKTSRVKIQHGDHFHIGRASLESHLHHASHEHGPHLETPHEHGPGTGHFHDPKTHMQITHEHNGEPQHTHVNIHLEDYIKENCSITGSICVPLTHCPPFCQLLHILNKPKIRNLVSELHCGFHEQDPMVCCPIDIVSEFSACNLRGPNNFNTQEIDVDTLNNITKILKPDETEPLICGSVKVDGRIFGGTNAAPGAWPWMALLWYKHKPTGLYFSGCGGTLISRHYVLTAAHCLEPEDSELVMVRLGENDVDQDHDCLDPYDVCICQQGCPYSSQGECLFAGKCAPEHQDYHVLNTFTHQKFGEINGLFINDIGLILLKKGVEISSYISPVCLPSLKDIGLTVGTATGWGLVNVDMEPEEAQVLQQVELELVERKECEDIWQRTLVDPNSQICVRATAGGRRNVFRGDSGCPVVHEVGSVFVQVAIVSSGSSLAGDDRPSFSCPLNKEFVDWIKQTVVEPLAVR